MSHKLNKIERYMKINRKDLLWFLQNIRRRTEGQELTDEQLADKLAGYIETNPGCVDMDGVSNPGRFSYSTVGYGIFSLMGEKYRMGRIEIFEVKTNQDTQLMRVFTRCHL